MSTTLDTILNRPKKDVPNLQSLGRKDVPNLQSLKPNESPNLRNLPSQEAPSLTKPTTPASAGSWMKEKAGNGSDGPGLDDMGRNETMGATTTPWENTGLSNVEIFRRNFPIKTQEEMEREEKRAKRDRLFASIGDGIAAISNLITASKGAPSVYDGRNSMSERARARWDKLRKEHEANKQAYLNGYMRAVKMDEDSAYKRASLAQKDAVEKNKQANADRTYLLNLKKINDDRTFKDEQLKLQTMKLVQQAEQFGAKSAMEWAKHNLDMEKFKATQQYPWFDKDGNLNFATNEYAARQNAIVNGTWVEDDITETRTETGKDYRGKDVNKTVTTTKKGNGRSMKPGSKSEDNTPPSRRGNNDNTPPSRRK